MRKYLILLVCPLLMILTGDFVVFRSVQSTTVGFEYALATLLIGDETPAKGDCTSRDENCGSLQQTQDGLEGTQEATESVEVTSEVGAGICTPDSFPESDIQVPPADSKALIDAIDNANADPDLSVICLSESEYVLTQADNESGGVSTGLPAITSEIVILGNNAVITRDSEDAFRIVYVGDDGILTLDESTIDNGRVEGEANGAGVFVDNGELHVISSTVSNNLNYGDMDPDTNEHNGGGIAQSGGLMTISDSQFSNNRARFGGAISISTRRDPVTTVIEGSTFENNLAASPLDTDNTNGGAIIILRVTPTGSIDILDSMFSGNTAKRGAGIYMSHNQGKNTPIVTLDALTFEENISEEPGSLVRSQMSGEGNRLIIGSLTIGQGNSEPYCGFDNNTDVRHSPDSEIIGGDGSC